MADDIDVARLVRAYLRLRDAQRENTKKYEAEDKKFEAAKSRIGAELLRFLNATKQEGARTADATFYREQEMKPSAHDWSALYAYIKENDAFDALEKRVKKTFVKEYMDANEGGLPPGITIYRKWVVRVREIDKDKDEA
jgi:hypothetical protein